MEKYLNLSIVILLFFMISCASKQKIDLTKSNDLNKVITERLLEIKSKSATPRLTNAYNQVANSGLLPPGSSSGLINLNGNYNYLKIIKDSVSGYFPYYGERQMGGAYTNDNGLIQFDGIPNDLTVTETKKNSYTIRFSINDKVNTTESYNVSVQLFNSLNSEININSSHRMGIKYSGKVKPYE